MQTFLIKRMWISKVVTGRNPGRKTEVRTRPVKPAYWHEWITSFHADETTESESLPVGIF